MVEVMQSVDVTVHKLDGSAGENFSLDPTFFSQKPNLAVLHQVVVAQLAAARSGTQSTKTRSEVSGGGAKPWRQKGTGRARAGSTRAPNFSGGGVALGPKPRDYRQRTPKKMIRLALKSALSDRAQLGRVAVVQDWAFDAPSTKRAKEFLQASNLVGKVLVVLSPTDQIANKSFRNLPNVQLISKGELNAYDVLRNDWVVFSKENITFETKDSKTKGANNE